MVNRAVVGSSPQEEVPIKVRRMVDQQNNFVMVAESSTHEVVPEGVLIPPLQERTAARNMLVRWHVLIKELSTIILLGKGSRYGHLHGV